MASIETVLETICPFQSTHEEPICCADDCTLWVKSQKTCTFKVIALELVKQNQNKGSAS